MSIELRGGVRASAVIGDSAFARQAARFLPDTRSRAVSAFDIQQKARLEEADGLDGALFTVSAAWPDPIGRRLTTDCRQALHGGNSDDLELWIMQRLEWLRITSRSAPMLGLVATMIPMGPALLALTRNDAQGIGENLVVAFSAVILALVAASITFFILTVRRRWLLQELRAVERAREAG